MSLTKYFQKENIGIAATKSNLTSVEEEEISEELLSLERREVKNGPVKKGYGNNFINGNKVPLYFPEMNSIYFNSSRGHRGEGTFPGQYLILFSFC